MTRRRTAGIVAIALLAVILPACTTRDAVTIPVDGLNFEFDPSTIRARVGDTVTIVLRNPTTIFHDLKIDRPLVHIEAFAGRSGRGTFELNEAGTYAMYCTVPGHRTSGMEGRLVVSDR